MRNVHKKEFDFLRLPEEALTEDRGYSFCSEPYLALADPLDSIQWKNDVFGVAGLFDSMVVELERQDGTLETALGAAVSMPKQSNAVGFIIDWRTNLITYGPGCYRVKVNWDIQGITGLYYAGNFELLPYTLEASEGTVQLIVNYDDKVLQDGINYTGSGFYTGLRFKGFFGNEQINSEHRNLLKANNVRQKVRNFSAPSYDLVTRPLTRCFTRPLKRMLLNASDIWISDYNAWNHEIYRYFNVILSDAAGIDFEGDETFVRQINATLLDKLWTTESKYDLKEAQPPQLSELFSFVCPSGSFVEIEVNGTPEGQVPAGSTVDFQLSDSVGVVTPLSVTQVGTDFQVLLPDLVCPDTDIEVNGVAEGSVVAGSTLDIQVTDYEGNPQDVDANLVGNNLGIQTKWWTRNPQWLPMPTILPTDNKFAGLYAVFEDDAQGNTITLSTFIAGLTLDYGDGTVVTTTTGVMTHSYNYATLSSPILQLSDGTNYKMVLVELELVGVPSLALNQNVAGRSQRVTGWLDIICSGSSLQRVVPSDNTGPANRGFAIYLQRLSVLNMAAGNFTQDELCNNLQSLKVLDYPNLQGASSLTRAFLRCGDIRDSNGSPISIATNQVGQFQAFADSSNISEFGNLDFGIANQPSGPFNNSKIKKVGNITCPNVTLLVNMFQNSTIETVGNITVGVALTNIQTAFNNCRLVRKVVFLGDMSGVTNTTNAFLNCLNLTELILTGLTRGFDIRNTQITGTALQDLFDSLGTASGSQTITLPTFTTGEPTTIATGKGYTIAYA